MNIQPKEEEQIEIFERILQDGTKMTLVRKNGKSYVTMETAGHLLEFSDPAKGISNLYNRRKEELDEYTKTIKSRELTESPRGVKCFDRTGFNLLCMFAETEKAKVRRKEILNIMDEYDTKGYVIPEFENDFDRQIFLIDRFREAIIEQREQKKLLEEQKRKTLEHDHQIADIYNQIETFIPLSDREVKKINRGIKEIYRKCGVPFWEVKSRISDVCGVYEVEDASRKEFSCIMGVINEYLDQRRLKDFG